MDNLELLVAGLKGGQLILYPTDTCLGLGHDIFSEFGTRKLYDLKEMPDIKPVSVLVSSMEMADEFAEINDLAKELWSNYLPGQMTLLLPRKDTLPNYLNPGSDLIGIRYIADDAINLLINKLGNPISTTSANRHGRDVVSNLDEFLEQFSHDVGEVNFLLDCNLSYPVNQSTIVSVEGDKLNLIREGVLLEELNKKFGAYIN